MSAKTLFSLGKLYPSDFLKPDEQPRCEPVELKLVMEDNGLVHLEKTAPKECMYGKYWYRSGINDSMRNELKDIVESILKVFKVKEEDVWLDIACNDGTLLSFVPKKCVRIGIDPADDNYKNEAMKHCDFHVQDYFSRTSYMRRATQRKAKVITSIAMFYDLERPEEFIKDIYDVLDDDGLWVLQLSYSPLMIDQLEFSNICHEHIFYYSFSNLKSLLEKHSFYVMDVQLNNTNAGSFRVYAMKTNADKSKYSSQTHRDVCSFRIMSLLYYEHYLRVDEPETWINFFERINKLKEVVVSFIKLEKAKGKVIMGYSASTKFNTALQYFGLNNEMITAIAERNDAKYGLRTVGTNIPIISEQEMRIAKPDYLLVGAAHFISEFMEREKELLKSGTKFIVTMPQFEIIEK